MSSYYSDDLHSRIYHPQIFPMTAEKVSIESNGRATRPKWNSADTKFDTSELRRQLGATRNEHSDRSVLELDMSEIDNLLEDQKSQWDPERMSYFTAWSKYVNSCCQTCRQS